MPRVNPRIAPRTSGAQCVREVLRDPADEGVKRDDLTRARGQGRVDEVRSDIPRAAGDDDARARKQTHARHSLCRNERDVAETDTRR